MSVLMKVLLTPSERRGYPDCPFTFPMELLNEEWASKNHDQTLSRLNQRGGMCPREIVANAEHRSYVTMPLRRAINQMKELVK